MVVQVQAEQQEQVVLRELQELLETKGIMVVIVYNGF